MVSKMISSPLLIRAPVREQVPANLALISFCMVQAFIISMRLR